MYKAGSTVYKTGTGYSSNTFYYGDGDYVTGRGSSISALTGYYKYEGALYDADGERVNGSTAFYFGGSVSTLYKGNGTKGYLRGDSVEAIAYNGTLYARSNSKVTTVGDECSLKPAIFKTRNVTALTV